MTVYTDQMRRDEIAIEIQEFLEEEGEEEDEGFTIGKNRYGILTLEPITVVWGYPGESDRWINSLTIEDGTIEFTESGGHHVKEDYESPQQVIDILASGAKTTRNYPT